jgi:D-alanine-D-alanine ligase
VDFRVDEKGNPYVLEINPLPSLSTEDVYSVISKVLGITYEKMLGKILNAALKRNNLIK